MRVPQQQRATALILDVVLLLTFACIIVGAGHGAGPVGFFLILGNNEPWGAPKLAGWLGVVVLPTALIFSRVWAYALMVVGGASLLVTSWALFAQRGEVVFVTPFWVLLIVRLAYLLLQTVRAFGSR